MHALGLAAGRCNACLQSVGGAGPEPPAATHGLNSRAGPLRVTAIFEELLKG